MTGFSFSPHEDCWHQLSVDTIVGQGCSLSVSSHMDVMEFGQYIALLDSNTNSYSVHNGSTPTLVYDTVTCLWSQWNVSDFGHHRIPLPDRSSYIFTRDIKKDMGGMGIGEVDGGLLYPHPSLKWGLTQ